MPTGGQITITLEASRAGVEISVADTGHGMSSDVMSRVFDAFFTTKGPLHGTGLGLFNVKSIIEAAGGSILLSSTPGAGTVFTATLPLGAPGAGARQMSALPPQKGRRVLVVEDDIRVRVLTYEILSAAGYDVLDVPNAKAARAAWKGGGPVPLVLSDLLLPDGNGLALAREFQANSPSLEVLIMSGFAPDPSDRAAIASGEVHFLAKPFGRHDLLSALQAITGTEAQSESAQGASKSELAT
jgi:CheY-like chemotaxis protein